MARTPAGKLTTTGAAKRLFPPEVRKWLKEQCLDTAKPKRRARKPKKTS